jgi:hypothetical protein
MVESAPVESSGKWTDPQLEYRSVEPWAVGGLLLALLSPVALLDGLWWLIAPLGVLANAVALRRVAAEPHRMGRAAALLGLGLSLFFGTAPWARSFAERLLLPEQARPTADQFFEFLRQGSPEKAVQLRFAPDYREPFDDTLWKYLRTNTAAGQELRRLVADPTVRTLLALGDRAQVRYFRSGGVSTDGARAVANLWYTVTFDDDQGRKKTFIVRVLLDRKPVGTPGLNPWKVGAVFGGINPDETSN